MKATNCDHDDGDLQNPSSKSQKESQNTKVPYFNSYDPVFSVLCFVSECFFFKTCCGYPKDAGLRERDGRGFYPDAAALHRRWTLALRT